jgi:hypothetical protein
MTTATTDILEKQERKLNSSIKMTVEDRYYQSG